MNLFLLKALALRLQNLKNFNYCIRIDDNLLKFSLDKEFYYLSLNKGNASFFRSGEELLASKKYNAPFDVNLKRLNNSKILEVSTDGNNRVLKIVLERDLSYKKSEFIFYLELTGRHTNAIITDVNSMIIDALRHINKNLSYREILPNISLVPLDQPTGAPKAFHTDINNENLDEILLRLNIKEREFDNKRLSLLANNDKKIKEIEKSIKNLPDEKHLLLEAQNYRANANLLLCNVEKIPKYKTTITIENRQIPINVGGNMEIDLQFRLAKKMEKKAKNIYKERENKQSKLEFLHKLQNIIRSATKASDFGIFSKSGTIKDKKKKQNFYTFFIENYKVSVGRNASENRLLLESASASDIWLHIQAYPSSHMIVHCGKNTPSEEVLKKSAKLLCDLNNLNDISVNVDYTRRKFVKLGDNHSVANVLYSRERTICIKRNHEY